MKKWNSPEVAELDVCLTADGRMGACDEDHQHGTPKNGVYPGGVDKTDDEAWDPRNPS